MNKSTRSVMTFKNGVHTVCHGKILSEAFPVQTAPLLERYTVTVAQNAGKPPQIVVAPGDKVKKYQLIARADGLVSANLHSPASGEVRGIIDVPGIMGFPVKAIEIISDGLDEALPPLPEIDWKNADAGTLLERIAQCGVVGMGGASFPTHVKLSPPPEKQVDTLILNGAECEPFLTADHRLMLEEPESVLAGAAIMGRILGTDRIFIGIEVNKINAMSILQEKAEPYGVKIVPLKVRYPQGSEKQLIDAVTGREVPAGGLPMDARCVVQNAGTAAAVARAVIDGLPLIERITTVTGRVIKKPGNWKLRIGTPVIEAVRLAEGVTEEPGKLILGGPMMGIAQTSFDVPVAKSTGGILLLSREQAVNYTGGNCIRCGRCVQGCPMQLLPCAIASAVESYRFDLAQKYHVMDCLECGACAYVCPARRPLVQHNRRAKAEIRRQMKK